MRKLIKVLIVCMLAWLGSIATAQAQTTVSGHIFSLNGSPITSGSFVRFRLRNYSGAVARLDGTGVCAVGAVLPVKAGGAISYDLTPNASGLISSTICGNDVITPTNTFYSIEFWSNGVVVSQQNFLVVGSTFNFDTAIPISSPPQAPPLPAGSILLGTVGHFSSYSTTSSLGDAGGGFGTPNTWSALQTFSSGLLSSTITDSALTAGNCVQATTAGLLTTVSGPCGTSSGTLTATGSPVSGQAAFWSGGTSLTGSANWLYSASSGHTLIQGANNTDAFFISRFTDSSPTGNFLHFQNAAKNADLFKLDVLGNMIATSATFTGAPANFYVATGGNGGSDSNDCLSATVSGNHGPCLTVQHAFDIAFSYVESTCPTINVGVGTFSTVGGVTISGPVACGATGAQGGITLTLTGAGATTILDTSAACGTVETQGGAALKVRQMTLQNTGSCSGNAALWAQNNGYVIVGSGLVFGAASQHMHAEAGGVIEVASPYTISGNASNHVAITTNGVILMDGETVTCSGVTAFSSAFALVQHGGVFQYIKPGGTDFSGCGSVTGQRFIAQGGTINMSGYTQVQTPWKTLPGNSDGRIYEGGQFDPQPTTTLTSCTNGSLQSGSSDSASVIGFGGSASTCTLVFSRTLGAAPSCTAQATNAAALSVSVGTGNVVIQGSFVNGQNIYVNCSGVPYL